jgi:thioredoxin 1
MPSPNIIAVNESNFDAEVVKTPIPVLVDFWAEHCGPCAMLEPVLEEIAKEKAGAFKVAKVNAVENPGLSSRFGVRAVPTLLFFKNGAVQEQTVGRTSKRDLIAKLEALA